MSVSEMKALERVARVITGQRLSLNGEGDLQSAGHEVDARWRQHADEARAILNALREPDNDMARVGDPTVWTAMVRTALGEDIRPVAQRHIGGEGRAIYQKPLG